MSRVPNVYYEHRLPMRLHSELDLFKWVLRPFSFYVGSVRPRKISALLKGNDVFPLVEAF